MGQLIYNILNFAILQSLSPKATKTLGTALFFILAAIQAQDTVQLQECVEGQGFKGLVVFIYDALTGGFGALIMIVAGLGAILAAAFGQFKAALSALVVALGVFVLQIFVRAFFSIDFAEVDNCVFDDGGTS